MERIKYAINRGEYSYFWGRVLKEREFECSPYTWKYMALVEIGSGYEFEKGYGVLSQWGQSSHPQYADYEDGGLKWFPTLEEAKEAFQRRVAELEEEYPE